jgi:CRAL/TRIO domain
VSPDGKLTAILDFTDATYKTSPPLKTSVSILNILQNHYPEHLHESIVWRPHSLFQMLWTGVSPFMAADTRKRVVICAHSDPKSPEMLAARCAQAAPAPMQPSAHLRQLWCVLSGSMSSELQ